MLFPTTCDTDTDDVSSTATADAPPIFFSSLDYAEVPGTLDLTSSPAAHYDPFEMPTTSEHAHSGAAGMESSSSRQLSPSGAHSTAHPTGQTADAHISDNFSAWSVSHTQPTPTTSRHREILARDAAVTPTPCLAASPQSRRQLDPSAVSPSWSEPQQPLSAATDQPGSRHPAGKSDSCMQLPDEPNTASAMDMSDVPAPSLNVLASAFAQLQMSQQRLSTQAAAAAATSSGPAGALGLASALAYAYETGVVCLVLAILCLAACCLLGLGRQDPHFLCRNLPRDLERFTSAHHHQAAVPCCHPRHAGSAPATL